MKRISVFCGSSQGNNPLFMELAFSVGAYLAEQGYGIIYGGAQVGLMGAVADGALEKGGEVIGVLPTFLGSKEIAHPSLTQLIMVDSMHERKLKMSELCNGAIALPGGYGTMEELFELITWAQLGLLQYSIGILNMQGFYDSLKTQIDVMVKTGFLKELNRAMLLEDEKIDGLLQKMRDYEPVTVKKWIDDDTT